MPVHKGLQNKVVAELGKDWGSGSPAKGGGHEGHDLGVDNWSDY